MSEEPKGPKKAMVVSKMVPTGKKAEDKPEGAPAKADPEAAATEKAEPAPKPAAGLAKRVLSFQVGGKPTKKA